MSEPTKTKPFMVPYKQCIPADMGYYAVKTANSTGTYYTTVFMTHLHSVEDSWITMFCPIECNSHRDARDVLERMGLCRRGE